MASPLESIQKQYTGVASQIAERECLQPAYEVPSVELLTSQCLQPNGEVHNALKALQNRMQTESVAGTDPMIQKMLRMYQENPTMLQSNSDVCEWVTKQITQARKDLLFMEEAATQPFALPEDITTNQIFGIIYLSRFGGTVLDGYTPLDKDTGTGKREHYPEAVTFGHEHQGVNGFAKTIAVIGADCKVHGLLPDVLYPELIPVFRQRIRDSGIRIFYAGLKDSEAHDFQLALEDPLSILPSDNVEYFYDGINTIGQITECKNHLLETYQRTKQQNPKRNHLILVTNVAHGMRTLRMIEHMNVVPEGIVLDVIIAGVPRHKAYEAVIAGEIRGTLYYQIAGYAAPTIGNHRFLGNINLI
jgi:hypothetical protein